MLLCLIEVLLMLGLLNNIGINLIRLCLLLILMGLMGIV